MYIGALAAVALGFSVILSVWGTRNAWRMRNFPSLDSCKPPHSGPLVSVIIPVRNQELSVGACLESITKQDYPLTEVIVVDGQSTDRTVEIVRGFAATTLIREPSLPYGWVGKNWACHVGYLRSKGEYLLFTDGDVVLGKNTISAAMSEILRFRCDLLSLWPRIIMNTFWEKLVLPLMFVAWFVEFGGRDVNSDERRWAAFGPFILARRSSYEDAGGHESVRQSTGEDYRLAQRFKEMHLAVRVMAGTGFVSTRMYSTLAEIWHGFLKNEFESFDYSAPPAILASARQAAVYILPFLFFVPGILLAPNLSTALILSLPCLTMTVVMVVLYRTMGYDAKYAVLSAVAAAIYLGIRAHSIYLGVTAKGVEWKGRVYEQSRL